MAYLPKKRFWDHVEELRKRLKWSFLAVFALFVFMAAFQIRVADVGGVPVPYPYPDPIHPAASQFFNATLHFLQPPNVESTVLGPTEAFVVQLQTAFFLAVAMGMPVVAYEMGMFVAPALYDRERKIILRLVVPAVLLFLAGVLIAFFIILPFTFRFLYSVAGGLGVDRPLLSLDAFLSFTLIFTVGFGATFELPIVMYALTASTLVKAATWRKHWRFATAGIFFFAAVITPDASGVTMLIVAFPMLGLYVAGYGIAALHERRREQRRRGADEGSREGS